MPGTVHVEREGAVGWIVFDHPERRNALSVNMWSELASAAARLGADDGVRVVVMRGAGDAAFVSGADISQFAPEQGDRAPEQGNQTESELSSGGGNAFAALAALRKPVLAMIHGYCIGGGVAVALGADLRYAAEDARFAIPAARLGVGYDAAGIEELARLVGLSNAKEILFSARQYDATEALHMGLVNRVLPSGEIEGFVRALSEQIASNAPLTVRSVKVIASELHKPLDARDRDAARSAVRACFESEDFAEGVSAFLAKRKPAFKGR